MTEDLKRRKGGWSGDAYKPSPVSGSGRVIMKAHIADEFVDCDSGEG